MVIVDSSVWIDYLGGVANDQTLWLEKAVDREVIGLTTLTLCEVLQGVRTQSNFQLFKRDLMRFAIFDAGSVAIAIRSAQNYLVLRQCGFTVRKTIDCLIATFCLEEDHQLLHRDRDFDAFETQLGLRVLHVPEP